jgi:tetratricopeptide (TPR) repeat protein
MVGDQRIRISKALIGLDERDGAREHLYIAIDILTQTYGEANIRVSKAHLALGLLEYQAGNADLALTHVHKAVAIHSDSLEPDHPDRIEPLSLRANLLHERERYDEAYADYAEVLRLRGLRAITTQHAREQIATAHANIADVLTELGRYDGAILHGESAVAEYDAWAPRNDIRIAITLHALARAERARGNKTIAHEYWQRAAAIAQANDHVELLGLIEHARAAAKSER